MKASDKPVISKKWWTKEKPADIKGADLEKALAACEKALDDAKKSKDAKSIEAALESLDELSDAAAETSKECAKKKLKDVASVLDKFDKVIDAERAELEKLQSALEKQSEGGEDEDEEARGVLKEEYLARMIKMLRGGEQLQFCLGLNKQNPSESLLVLCNKRKPERLFKIVKQTGEFSNRLLTFGTVLADGKILDLKISEDAKEPAQIVKTTKEFLKSNRELKFRKVRVHAAGEVFEEDMGEEKEAPQANPGPDAGAGDLQARIRQAELADLAWQKVRVSISDQIAQVQRELNGFQDADATAVHDGLSRLIDKLPDPGFNALSQSQDAGAFTSNLEKTRQRVVELKKLIGQGGALQTVDSNPFFKTDLVGTVNSALSSITKELQIA